MWGDWIVLWVGEAGKSRRTNIPPIAHRDSSRSYPYDHLCLLEL